MVNPREDTTIQSCFSLSLLQRPLLSNKKQWSDIPVWFFLDPFFVSFVLHLGRETHIRLLKTFRIQSVIEGGDCVAIGQSQKGNADVYGTTAGPLILLFLILMNFWAGLLLLLQIKEWKRREREACCGMRQSFSFPSSRFPNSRGSCLQTLFYGAGLN